MLRNYSLMPEAIWQGRIDSQDDFEDFRWHQWIKKLDLNDKNLKPFEARLGFAILGFESDTGVRLNKGRPGASKGPNSIRRELASLPCQFSNDVLLFDAGNISSENISLEQAQNSLSKAVDKILDLNLFPILLGGGHEIAFGHFKGILGYLEKKSEDKNIGIINFDAHFDLRPYSEGGSSGTMFKQIYDLSQEKSINYNYLCIGIQKHGNTQSLFNTADRLGVDYILSRDMVAGDNDFLLEKIDDFIKSQDHLYVTICSDVFSSAFAPGVSAPQPLGLEPDRVLTFLKYILRSKKAISFDIAEVSPRFDQDDATANLASVMVFSLVYTLAKIY